MENEMNQYLEIKYKAEYSRLTLELAEAMLKNLQREIEDYKRKHNNGVQP